MRRPTSIAWCTLQSWLMSHMRSTSGPIASRITRTRSTDSPIVFSLPHCIFIWRKPMSVEPRARLREVVDRVRAHERAARVRGHAIAQTRRAARTRTGSTALPLRSQHAMSTGGEREREDAARARAARRAAALRGDRLRLGGIVADDQLAERLHRRLERRRQRAAEEREADADEPLVGAELERDELARLGRGAGSPTTSGLSAGMRRTRVVTCVIFIEVAGSRALPAVEVAGPGLRPPAPVPGPHVGSPNKDVMRCVSSIFVISDRRAWGARSGWRRPARAGAG